MFLYMSRRKSLRSKLRTAIFGITCCLATAYVPSALASPSDVLTQLDDSHAKSVEPQAVVLEAIGKLKQSGDQRAVYDYVDWDFAYQTFTNRHFKSVNVNNGIELREAYDDIATRSPRVLLRGAANKMPPDVQKRFLAKLDAQQSKPKQPAYDPALASRLYEIKRTSVQGDEAEVVVTVSSKGAAAAEQTLKLHKKGDNTWMFNCPALVSDPFKLCE